MEARLYTPGDPARPRSVTLDGRQGIVAWQGQEFTPLELERAYPGYVLEVTTGYPHSGVNAGFTGAILFDEDAWHPTQTPLERVMSSYWCAFWLTFGGAYWLEGQGIEPWDWLLPDGAAFFARWLVGIAMIALAAVPVHRWLTRIVDGWVVERIQHYTNAGAVGRRITAR